MSTSPAHQTASQRWAAAVEAEKAKGSNAQNAVIAANRKNPGLREAMLAEVNGAAVRSYVPR